MVKGSHPKKHTNFTRTDDKTKQKKKKGNIKHVNRLLKLGKGFYEDVHSLHYTSFLMLSFIFIITKKSKASDEKDYRHVSFVGVSYKLVAKALANRLKKVL